MKRLPTLCAVASTAAIVLSMTLACDSTANEPVSYYGWDYQPYCGGSGGGCGPGVEYGGCWNPRGVADLAVTGPSCLTATIDNCASITLEVHNDCAEDAVIGGLEVPAGSTVGGDPVVDADGIYHLIGVDGAQAVDNEVVTLDGTLGTAAVTISMVVSAELC